MARVRTRHTEPEMQLRRALWRVGLRYRLHGALPGCPDVVFNRARVAVFVDGCFWHGCPQHGGVPRTNTVFWRRKIGVNTNRDRRVDGELVSLGWRVIRVWEHSVENTPDRVADRIARIVRSPIVAPGPVRRI
jgi:DNA mismatch endonuclease (patch repair protein)